MQPFFYLPNVAAFHLWWECVQMIAKNGIRDSGASSKQVQNHNYIPYELSCLSHHKTLNSEKK